MKKRERNIKEKMSMIKAVLLDIDNTLLDFDAYVEETLKKGF